MPFKEIQNHAFYLEKVASQSVQLIENRKREKSNIPLNKSTIHAENTTTKVFLLLISPFFIRCSVFDQINTAYNFITVLTTLLN